MKQRYSRAVAMDAAGELCARLKPETERLLCVGSLRRRKELVGDIELLYIPKTEVRRTGLFKDEAHEENFTDKALDALLAQAVIAKRPNVNGHFSWGPQNKYAVHIRTGVPVDFFATTAPAWFNAVVCRTGSKESNTAIAMAALTKGWEWHPLKHGFTDEHGRWQTVTSEQDVFRLVGLPYKEPWER